jgi:hypothetical protein
VTDLHGLSRDGREQHQEDHCYQQCSNTGGVDIQNWTMPPQISQNEHWDGPDQESHIWSDRFTIKQTHNVLSEMVLLSELRPSELTMARCVVDARQTPGRSTISLAARRF